MISKRDQGLIAKPGGGAGSDAVIRKKEDVAFTQCEIVISIHRSVQVNAVNLSPPSACGGHNGLFMESSIFLKLTALCPSILKQNFLQMA